MMRRCDGRVRFKDPDSMMLEDYGMLNAASERI